MRSSLIEKAIFLLFLLSGAGYLVFPGQHYNAEGWYVWVKYVLAVALLGASFLFFISSPRARLNPYLVLLVSLLYALICLAILAGASPEVAFLYAFPALFAIIFKNFQQCIGKIGLIFVVSVALLGVLYEYFYLGGFDRFQPNGYRGVSILINPNNLGIFSVLLAYIAYQKSWAPRKITLLIAFVFVLYSGSKTAAILWAVYFFFTAGMPSRVILFLASTIAIPIIYWLFSADLFAPKLERYSLDSLFIRLGDLNSFISSIDNFAFPFQDGEKYYVDNAFVQAWINLGLPVMFLYLIITVAPILLYSDNRLLFLLLLLAGMTTNIFYIWPVAYIYWIAVSDTINSLSLRKLSYKLKKYEKHSV